MTPPISLDDRRNRKLRDKIRGLLASFAANRMSTPEGARLYADKVQSLMAEIVERDNKRDPGTPCDHVTLRPAYLPCPHPDCWKASGRMYFFQRPRAALPWWSLSEVAPSQVDLEHEEWEQTSFLISDRKGNPGEVFAWRRYR